LLAAGTAVLVVCGLIWSAEWMFPATLASGMVLVAVTAIALWIAKPGWNLRPGPFRPYWLALFGLLLASAAFAAWFLDYFEIAVPYELAALDIRRAIPFILVITGIEELLFRQAMYRWLERRQIRPRSAVLATALAFGWAHAGPLFTGSPVGATFHLLQTGYLVWIGILLGEARRVTGSWLMPWLGHFAYNVVVLHFLSTGMSTR